MWPVPLHKMAALVAAPEGVGGSACTAEGYESPAGSRNRYSLTFTAHCPSECALPHSSSSWFSPVILRCASHLPLNITRTLEGHFFSFSFRGSPLWRISISPLSLKGPCTKVFSRCCLGANIVFKRLFLYLCKKNGP